ncbi:DNA ligase D [Sphingobium sp. DEHP117]|uniref:DNA ligase D n=1 Tax=Sphingobium sp. DEHP117 TaxID=2993436 RepID=UPI0027D6D0FE|nr:DNA ligase D [Sphingobium sp. DEHP117]MDQ4419460.1 DNA ligase D [Sphingobium sp. DEHP117]
MAKDLAEYNAKRDFTRTREPAGRKEKGGGNRFIVQKHDATRLHYDFRLEVDGVLKSWAVTRGPSLDPADKRLAVRTEDHPLSYAEFEGSIPKGEYGGGTVMLWDRGTWAPVAGKSAKDIEKGHLHFTLDGERMKGEWLLVRMKGRKGEKRENWLLRKVEDAHSGGADDLVNQQLTSVLTGRTMSEIAHDDGGVSSLAGKSGDAFAKAMATTARHNLKVSRRTKAKGSAKPPAFRAVQLATLVDSVPSGNDWFHEIKFDGYRALVAASGDAVTIYTRTGQDWTDKFVPLRDAIATLDLPSCLIDGEITAPGADGNPSFAALQDMLKRGHGEQGEGQRLDYHAFDLLELNGEDLSGLGNLERKERLASLLAAAQPPVHVADHVIGAGEKLYAGMCKAGQEGIIAKRAAAPYRGRRTREWLKVKCTLRQEFVIVGWQPSKAKGRAFASLLLAQNEAGGLVYKGKVGTGFDDAAMKELAIQLGPLAADEAVVEAPRAEIRHARWVRPELVAEVAFATFTAEGRVRHGSFLGLRADKEAKDVTPETPSPAPKAKAPATAITITHPERLIFPDGKLTKGDLAQYYQAVAPIMLPHVARRPISLMRCPQGRGKKCFFQKHDSGSFGESVRHVAITEKDGGAEDYLYVEEADGILACVQMGTIEFHGWGAHVADVEQPDRMIFDLDPDEGLGFEEVKRAAFDLRQHLSDIGLVSFALLSGGKGVHVIVPLIPGHGWEAHKDFSRRFADALSMAEPDRFVATMSKAKRKGRIFIDWLRNQRGSTAVVPYSARARAGAPVAAPVGWEELRDIKSPARYTNRDADELLRRAGSATLKGWGFMEQQLPEV